MSQAPKKSVDGDDDWSFDDDDDFDESGEKAHMNSLTLNDCVAKCEGQTIALTAPMAAAAKGTLKHFMLMCSFFENDGDGDDDEFGKKAHVDTPSLE